MLPTAGVGSHSGEVMASYQNMPGPFRSVLGSSDGGKEWGLFFGHSGPKALINYSRMFHQSTFSLFQASRATFIPYEVSYPVLW